MFVEATFFRYHAVFWISDEGEYDRHVHRVHQHPILER